MKKSIVFFILTIGWLIEGCYEDKGHYDYIRISGPEVTGIEKFYTVYDGGNFDIHPSVTWTYGELEITPIPGKWTGYLFPIRLN